MGDLTFANVMPYHVAYVDNKKSEMPLQWSNPRSMASSYATHAMIWCHDTCGPYGDRWKRLGTVFCFVNEEDALFFKLRFG